jgi:hypothetical protein
LKSQSLSRDDQFELARKAVEYEDIDVLDALSVDIVMTVLGTTVDRYDLVKRHMLKHPLNMDELFVSIGAADNISLMIMIVENHLELLLTEEYVLIEAMKAAASHRSERTMYYLYSVMSEHLSQIEAADAALAGASSGGHMDTARTMISLGASDFDLALLESAESGHVNIVLEMINLGATDLNSALHVASEHGRTSFTSGFF